MIKKEQVQIWASFVFRIICGALFIYSGFSKASQPIEYFQIAVSRFKILPGFALENLLWVVPLIEYFFGGFLLVGLFHKQAAFVLSAMTLIFQIVIGQAYLRGLPIDECGCFGDGFIHLSLYGSFALDTVLVIMLLHIAQSENSFLSLDRKLP